MREMFISFLLTTFAAALLASLAPTGGAADQGLPAERRAKGNVNIAQYSAPSRPGISAKLDAMVF